MPKELPIKTRYLAQLALAPYGLEISHHLVGQRLPRVRCNFIRSIPPDRKRGPWKEPGPELRARVAAFNEASTTASPRSSADAVRLVAQARRDDLL